MSQFKLIFNNNIIRSLCNYKDIIREKIINDIYELYNSDVSYYVKMNLTNNYYYNNCLSDSHSTLVGTKSDEQHLSDSHLTLVGTKSDEHLSDLHSTMVKVKSDKCCLSDLQKKMFY